MARRRAKPLALASAHRLTASWRLGYTTVGWRVAFVVCESRPGLALSRRLAHTTVGWRASRFASTGCSTADAMLATFPYYGGVAHQFCGLEPATCLYYGEVARQVSCPCSCTLADSVFGDSAILG